jgi:hypothetical protein
MPEFRNREQGISREFSLFGLSRDKAKAYGKMVEMLPLRRELAGNF